MDPSPQNHIEGPNFIHFQHYGNFQIFGALVAGGFENFMSPKNRGGTESFAPLPFHNLKRLIMHFFGSLAANFHK